LGFLIDVGETLESELPPELRPQTASGEPRLGGLSTIVDASADYAHTRQSVQFAATASTAFKYYRQLDEVAGATHGAALRATVRLPKHGSLQVSQTAAYSPSYLYQLFPTAAGESLPTDPDFHVATQSFSYGTSVAVAFGSVRTILVTVTGEHSRTHFPQQTLWRPNLDVYSGGATVTRTISRNGTLFADYQYRKGDFGFGGRAEQQRVSVGVEYSKALSVRQRARFRFDIAPASIKMPAAAVNSIGLAATSTTEDTESVPNDSGLPSIGGQVRASSLEGDARVVYQFRRTLQAQADYRRGVDYVPLLARPVLIDSARTELTGTITRHLNVSASAGYANGASAFYAAGNDVETRTGEVKVRYTLRRSTTIYAQYLYFYYDLRQQAELAPNLPSVFGQHAIRVGLTLSVKALGK
jgi:hypothetical protein